MHTISGYALQVRLDKKTKRQSWNSLDGLAWSIHLIDKVFLGEIEMGMLETIEAGSPRNT